MAEMFFRFIAFSCRLFNQIEVLRRPPSSGVYWKSVFLNVFLPPRTARFFPPRPFSRPTVGLPPAHCSEDLYVPTWIVSPPQVFTNLPVPNLSAI